MLRNSFKIKIVFFLVFFCLISAAQEKPKLIEDINLNIGVTLFKNPYKDNSLGSDMAYVATALNLGLEFYNKKYNISIEARKTVWISLSASSYSTDINAIASYNQIGVTKYFNISTNRSFGINLSHIWSAEYNSSYLYGTPKPASFYLISNYWSSKDISLALNINLTKKIFTEIRFNYYYETNNSKISRGINENRIQLSFIYKINPLKKK